MSGCRKKTSTVKYLILMSRVVIGQSVDPLDHCSLESFQSGHQ